MGQLDYQTTGQQLAADTRNQRTEDPHELAAVDAILAIAGRSPFAPDDELTVAAIADETEVAVTVSKST